MYDIMYLMMHVFFLIICDIIKTWFKCSLRMFYMWFKRGLNGFIHH